jgi:hypothetical protein
MIRYSEHRRSRESSFKTDSEKSTRISALIKFPGSPNHGEISFPDLARPEQVGGRVGGFRV